VSLVLDTHAAIWYFHSLKELSSIALQNVRDRLIAATALHLGLALVTRDRRLQDVGIKTIW
jgi:PIN domain nuclease of toxin-antitoxin system